MAKIKKIATKCQKDIDRLLEAAISEQSCVQGFLRGRDIQQMKERYEQWSGNLGALLHFESSLSLEHRLQDAPLVRESILNTLNDLHVSIKSAIDITTGIRPNRTTGPLSNAFHTDLFDCDTSSESDTSSVRSSNGGRNVLDPTSEIQELISAIKTGLDSLFKASIFVRKLGVEAKGKYVRALVTETPENRADIRYINYRYPSLKLKNPQLATRLGDANARRRQYLKSLRNHNERLSTAAAEGDSHETDTAFKKQPELIVQKTLTNPALFKRERTESRANADAPAPMHKISRRAPAMSAMSLTRSYTSASDEELHFPPMPAETHTNSPILCPYCLTSLQLKDESSESQWKAHVLEHLEPYICTFPSCGLDGFQSQHAWFEHELQAHRCRWVCSICFVSFRSPEDLKGHISLRHGDVVSDRQLSKIIDQSKRPIDSIQLDECPFCESLLVEVDLGLEIGKEKLAIGPDKFRRHLGQHLHKAALFALDDSILDRFWLNAGENPFLADDPEYIQDASWNLTPEEQPNQAKYLSDLSDDSSTGYERNRKTNDIKIEYSQDALHPIEQEVKARKSTLGKEHPDTLRSMHTLAICYSEAGRRQEALQLMKRVVKARRVALGKEHPETLRSIHALAIRYGDAGRRREARQIMEQVVGADKRTLGDEHPNSLGSIHNLALGYSDTGREQEALQLMERVVKERRVALGKEHPETLRSILALAIRYGDAGRRQESLQLMENVVEASKRTLGDGHPDTLGSIHNLNLRYSEAGRRREALQLMEQVVEANKRILGDEHPNTLGSIHNLALGYSKADRRQESLQLTEQVVEARKRTLSDEHPDTLGSIHNLALMYSEAGRLQEALQLMEQVVEANKRTLGDEHPNTLSSIHNLALRYSEAGRRREALQLMEQVVEANKRTLGDEHPNTLGSIHNLALMYSEAGRRREALQLMDQVVEANKRTLGGEHPDTLRSIHNLALRYSDAGRGQEALQLMERVVEARRVALGKEHPETLRSIHALAIRYGDAGRRQESLQLMENVVEASKRTLGDGHPDTLGSIHSLALKYSEAGRRQEALQLTEQVVEARKRTIGGEHPDSLLNIPGVRQGIGSFT
ncbi:hypothetical protein MMC29_006067 [Sticta canariensis]|nr:hypothetical protein [Sticta canariensis]